MRFFQKHLFLFLFLSFFSLLFSYLVYKHSRGEFVLLWQHKAVTRVVHELGFAYQAPLRQKWMSSHERPSSAKIFENGIELRGGNTAHEDIRKLGLGRFSFWHDHVYFSASDNSDPRTNGRKYEIVWPIPVSMSFAGCLYLLTLLITSVTGLAGMQILRQELGNLKGTVPIHQKLRTLFRRKDHLASSLFFFLLFQAIALLLYGAYMLLQDPVQTLEFLERHFLYVTAYLFAVALGYSLGRTLRNKERLSGGTFFGVAAGLTVVFFFLLRPGLVNNFSEIDGEWVKLAGLLLLGLFLAYYSAKWKPIVSAPSSRTFTERGALALVILASIVLALPGLTKPIATWWDISGYMDSHMYDFNAHDIATGRVPQGNALVMPLYQYGMAFIYLIFGHFFYIQQIVNIFMAVGSITFLCLAAWNVFRKVWAVWIVGLIAAFTVEYRIYIYYTQIENWYVPLVSLSIFGWSMYWKNPVISRLSLFAVAVGLAFNCRAQGAFFFGFLCLTPFFIAKMPFGKRIIHSLAIIFIIGLTLLPWTIRNYIYEHRFSPRSDQAIIITINDPRTGFYGLRHEFFYNRELQRWENRGLMSGFDEVYKEYVKKYPDKAQRNQAIQWDALKNTIRNPVWTVKAAFWRTLSCYGLLPPGIYAEEGPKPTDWKAHWRDYFYRGFAPLFFIAFSLTGFLVRRDRTALFLFLCVASNLTVTIFAPTVESRLSYPIFPLHTLLGVGVFFRAHPALGALTGDTSAAPGNSRNKVLLGAGVFAAVVFLVFCHQSIGRDNLYRPLMEKAVLLDPQMQMNPDLPALNDYYRWLNEKKGPAPAFHTGQKVRLRCRVTNYMLPPKIGVVFYLPEFAWSPSRERFFYSFPVESGIVGLTYFGAYLNAKIREDDIVDIEGTILLAEKNKMLTNLDFWVRAEKIFFVKKR